jgi:hypothetical protein
MTLRVPCVLGAILSAAPRAKEMQQWPHLPPGATAPEFGATRLDFALCRSSCLSRQLPTVRTLAKAISGYPQPEMVTLRCTTKAAKAFGFQPISNAPAGTSPLGDWYVNLIPTAGGGVFLFMNEQSLLTVIVPRAEQDLLNVFVKRVANILSMIGISNDRIELELLHFLELRAGKTTSKRLLGVMNDHAWRCQEAIDEGTPEAKVSLSDLEFSLANMPQATLAFRTAAEMTVQLLESDARFGSA